MWGLPDDSYSGKEQELAEGNITMEGVSVHNLKHVDLAIPRQKLVMFCGVSGSGKTSMALDTLYAEGQRRYIESFSAYTRQALERLEKPAAERIDGIPPAVAVTRKNSSRSSRSTIGTATEATDYLRLLFAKIGTAHCLRCRRAVRKSSPQTVVDWLEQQPAGRRLMVGFRVANRPLSASASASPAKQESPDKQEEDEQEVTADQQETDDKSPRDADSTTVQLTAGDLDQTLRELREQGFRRVVVGDKTDVLEESFSPPPEQPVDVVVDRLVSGGNWQRLKDSLETAFRMGGGECCLWIEAGEDPPADRVPADDSDRLPTGDAIRRVIDGKQWLLYDFSERLRCAACDYDCPSPEPKLFSFNCVLGACPECEGFGNIHDIDMELVVPDSSKTLREGAIAPWNTPAYAHELDELLALAEEYQIPVDVPFRELSEPTLTLIRDGIPEREFGGLRGFFAWLERRKYKLHLRVFLSRWRSYRHCPRCQGARLRPEALATTVNGKNIAEVTGMRIDAALEYLRSLKLDDWQRVIARVILDQLDSRLHYLNEVGLGYLSLERSLKTLSGGEAQRVALTTALGSSLVNMLYVLDEPSVGLHPDNVRQLVHTVQQLRDRGNTVVVVEHEEAMFSAADHLIEFGPQAGDRGGHIVFEGTLDEMLKSEDSLTGDYLMGRRGSPETFHRRSPNRGWIRLTGARGNNLANVTADFPLGTLCLVTGVSGAGKSSLVQDTLYGALCRRKRKDAEKPLDYDDVVGDGQIDDVVLIDQSPIGRSPRSNPVTYIKAFDQIRAVFADTIEARTHNYGAGHFSFNVDGGRCAECQGDGHLKIDMQFLADVYMRCRQCDGARYKREILQITYRGRNIADVLSMTVREAFSFFRGQTKVQAKLKRLIDVGLDYLRLGQAANTLSAGEAQRLKLATFLSTTGRHRTLFIIDEPTTGLHFADVVKLMDCFEALLSVGHSLIIVEHNLQLMKSADYIIDLGPGAGADGGQIVAHGTPEEIAGCAASITGRYLADALGKPEKIA